MSIKIDTLGCCAMAMLLSISSLFAATRDLQLVEAAKQGDREAVRSLLKQHVDVNTRQQDGTTALAWAAHRDDLEAAALLLGAGADVNAADDFGVTPLSLACVNGGKAMVEKLLKAGANPNAPLPAGETPLMTASRTGNADVVRLLLGNGANVHAKETRRGQTALMWAVAERHPQVVRVLLEHKANVQARSHSGFSPFLFAAQQGDLASAQLLLAAGANVNESAPEDGSALVVATLSGHEEFALFLLGKGADPNATDSNGISALHYAILKGLSLISGVQLNNNTARAASYMFRPNMTGLIKELLARGADPNLRILKAPPLPNTRRLAVISVVGATPFLLAAASYDVDLMGILVAAGANPNLTTQESTPAVIFAAGLAEGLGKLPVRTEEDDRRSLEATRLAVDLGGDVNAANLYGETALHGAAYVGSDAVVQFLLDKGARVNVEDNWKQTPLTIAQQVFPPTLLDDNLRPQSVHQTTVDLLLKSGARPLP